MFFLSKITKNLKRSPLLKSKFNFLLLAPILVFYIWLEFFYYKEDQSINAFEDEEITDYDIEDFRNECHSIKKGMSITEVNVGNKRILGIMENKKVAKFWIAKNLYKEHLPARDVCIVEFDLSDLVLNKKLSYIQ